MNPLVLTKISKHTLIGSLSAFLSFASKNNADIRLFFVYVFAGSIIIIAIVLLWEGREQIAAQSDEGINGLISSISSAACNNKPGKRQYLLTPQTRLELAIAAIIISISALVGGI